MDVPRVVRALRELAEAFEAEPKAERPGAPKPRRRRVFTPRPVGPVTDESVREMRRECARRGIRV